MFFFEIHCSLFRNLNFNCRLMMSQRALKLTNQQLCRACAHCRPLPHHPAPPYLLPSSFLLSFFSFLSLSFSFKLSVPLFYLYFLLSLLASFPCVLFSVYLFSVTLNPRFFSSSFFCFLLFSVFYLIPLLSPSLLFSLFFPSLPPFFLLPHT